ncbi:MAG: efflux RND transporter periplasmic adaptor subunit [Acetobacteraceae bacterium]
MIVAASDIPVYREFVGQTRGWQEVEVRARVQGYLQSIDFKQGGDVKAGQLLFTLDKRPYVAALAQAKATEAQLRSQYQQARNDARRYGSLVGSGVVSRQQADNAASQEQATRAALDAQAAVVKAKQVDLSYAEVRAPIAGRIGLTPYSIGDLVGTGSSAEKPLATITAIDPIKVRFTVSETDYLRYVEENPAAAGNAAQSSPRNLQLILADGSVYPRAGSIGAIDNAIDPTTGTLTVEALFPNPDGVLRPGQYAKVSLSPRLLKGAIAVPARSVEEQQGITSVAIVGPGDHVELRRVQIADRSGNLWPVTSGLEPGDRVIVEGLTKAVPDAVVQPQEVSLASFGSGAPAGGKQTPRLPNE